MRGLSKMGDKFKLRSVLCAVLALIATVCVITAILIMPKTNSFSALALTSAEEIRKAIADNAKEYSSELEIPIGNATTPEISISDKLTIGSAKRIRFTSEYGTKLIFEGGLTIEDEACVTFDVEAQFVSASSDTTTAQIQINGTLTVNDRLYNTAQVIINNKYDANAEIKSEGLIIGGSFNNDANNGGYIKIEQNATLTTRASTTYQVPDTNNSTISNRDGGTLMLKAGNGNLGLTVNGTITNDGSIIYDTSATAETALTNVKAVGATFVDIETNTAIPTSGINVLYATEDTTVTLSSSTTFSQNVTLLSFGKVTYKLNSDNCNFNLGQTGTSGNSSANLSLGGGVFNGVEFTQGANQLIFDGGAVWTKDEAPTYGSINTSGTLIFYDDNNQPYIYTNSDGKKNSSKAFFTITKGSLSVYGGTKITNYEMSGGSAKGGGVGVASGQTFNMYGGEISWCAVTGASNAVSGAGIYCAGSGTVNMYGGAVTHNALASVDTVFSADGAGIAVGNSSAGSTGILKIYGGEISYNHSAVGCVDDQGADAGGVMLSYSEAYMYGGAITGNFAGGSGGGVCAWCSTFSMYGGSISQNRAAFGGAIGTTSNGTNLTNVTVQGGNISDNEAYQNYSTYKSTTATPNLKWGGYGGGICLGSLRFPNGCTLTVNGDAKISGNKAYYGGGLAVYTDSTANSNQLIMSNGLISGNGAYELSETANYCNTYTTSLSQNGGGVYVYCSSKTSSTSTQLSPISRAILLLSGGASIDSSNSVSFEVKSETTYKNVAPIQVTGELTGNGLGALVYLDNDSISTLSNENVIGFGSGLSASTYLNKFVLDNANNSFDVNSTDTGIIISSASTYVAQITTTKYQTLEDAISYANNGNVGNVIEILRSATISKGEITINKEITIKPVEGADVTLVVASDSAFSENSALFNITSTGKLTLDGTNGNNSRLTIDGNGTGRSLKNSGNTQSITLFNINGGELIQKENVVLRNNLTTRAGSAVFISAEGGTFEMQGGVIESNTSENERGSAVFISGGTFKWTGGEINNNVSLNNSSADYGVYLSGGNLQLDGKIKLTNNVIYIGNNSIDVESNFDYDGSSQIPFVLDSAVNLNAGTPVVKIKSSTIDEDKIKDKFYLYDAQELDGLSLGIVNVTGSDYNYNIIIYKLTTYLFDSDVNELPEYADFDDLIETLEGKGAYSVKTRKGGLVLVVQVKYGVPLSSILDISDFYVKTGHTITSWGSYAYDTSLSYQESNSVSTNPVELEAVWTPNKYTINFNANAPKGQQNNATVNGLTTDTQNYTFGDEDSTISVTNLTAIGFVFGGWKDSEGKTLFTTDDSISSDDLKSFSTASGRGLYTLTAYANWINLFDSESDSYSGIGTQLSPFVIKNADQLTTLIKTVNGDEVTANDIQYYNSTDGSKSYSAFDYTGYYFKLGNTIGSEADPFTGTIGSEDKPFSGNFNGDFYTITLENATGLFGYLKNANVSNLIIAGKVTSESEGAYIGALADVAINSTLSNLANTASVEAKGTAGGLIGLARGITLSSSFNYGSVKAEIAGGLIGIANAEYSDINSVYNTGSVSATSCAGGLAGQITNTRISYAFNGGYVTATEGAVIGAIAGSGTQINLSGVYYNTDKTHEVKALGSGTETAVPLTSSKMYVPAKNISPSGMVLLGTWTYIYYDDNHYYYPQLQAFATSEKTSYLSETSVQLTVPDTAEGDVGIKEKPLEPSIIFTVTFELNGGTIDGKEQYSQVVTFGGEVKNVQKPADPIKIGYRFVGWYFDHDCTSLYDFNSGIPATNITIYAKWEAVQYKFVYATGGGTLTGDYSTYVNCESNSAVNLPSSYYITRTGYNFLGWLYNGKTVDSVKIENLCIVLYNGTEKVTSLSLTDINDAGTALIFSASWNETEYTITYKYKVGDVEKDLSDVENNNQTTYTINDIVSLARASLTGYTFQYWTYSDKEVINSSIIPAGTFGDLTIYGVFEPNKYEITFDVRELGELVVSDEVRAILTQNSNTGLYYATVTYGETLPALNSIEAKRDGYNFDGWYLSANPESGDSKYSLSGTFETDHSFTLYAKYSIITHTITVTVDKEKGYFYEPDFTGLNNITIENLQGDKFYSYKIIVNHGDSAYQYLVSPVAIKDQPFRGWDDNIEKTIKVIENITISAQFGVPITVVFTNAYTETQVRSFSTDDDGYLEGYDWSDFNKQPEVHGYTFTGWYLTNGNKIEDFDTYKFTEHCILFAQYEPKTVNVIFEVNDPFASDNGAPSLETLSVEWNYDSIFNNLPVPVYAGYKFLGWFDDKGESANPVANTKVKDLLADQKDLLADQNDPFSITLYAHWEAIVYTITYDLGASDASWVNETELKKTYTYAETFGGIKLDINNVATRTGYELIGWSGTGLSELRIVEGTTGNLTFTASWKINEYTVTFYANENGNEDGYFVVPSVIPSYVSNGKYYDKDGTTEVTTAGEHAYVFKITVTHGSTSAHPIEPEKIGYVFSDWYESFNNITADLFVYPKYTPREYTLYLSANGGAFNDNTNLKEYGKVAYSTDLTYLVLTDLSVERTGFTLKGWYDEGVNITMPASDYTLFAQWEPATYTITFRGVEGLKGLISANLSDSDISVEDGLFKVTHGYNLTSLNGIKKGNDTLVWYNNDGDVYIFSIATQDLELTAEWVNTGINITFVYNYDNISYTYPYASGANIIFPTPVRDGYEFTGWYDSKIDGNEVENATASSNVTYYAHWQAINYTITYILNGGTNSTENPETYTIETSTIELKNPTRTGYEFQGWYNVVSGNQITEIPQGSTGDITLLAQWEAKTYTITINGYTDNNNGAYNHTIELTYGDSDYSDLLNLWERNYFTVKIYLDEAKTNEFTKPVWTTVPALDEDLSDFDGNLYIAYEPIDYTVVFVGSTQSRTYNFTNNSDNQLTFGNDISPDSIPDGKTFDGWAISIANVYHLVDKLEFAYYGNEQQWKVNLYYKDSPVTAVAVGNIRLYPQYETTTYTIKFDGNRGTGTMPDQEFVYGILQVLSENEYTRTGYNFAGWSTLSDGDVVYTDGKAITLTSTQTEITLYAVWTPIVYTVTFILNGGSTTDQTSLSVYIDNEVELISASKTGYTLSGWKLGEETTYSSSFTINAEFISKISGNKIELVAQWTANRYTVTFSANGGKFNDDKDNYTIDIFFDANYDPPEDKPTRLGYTFAGWYYNGEKITGETPLTTAGDHTVTAQWTANEYTVTFETDNGTTIDPVQLSFDVTSYLQLDSSLTKTGYSLNGWRIKTGAYSWSESYTGYLSLNTLLTKAYIENNNTFTLKADWSVIEYSITYILNGGTNSTENPENYTIETETSEFTLSDPTRTGYDFRGWYTDSGFAERDKFNYTKGGTTGPLVLYAKWEVVTFTVTISAGDGTFKDLSSDYSVEDNRITLTWEYGKNILPLLYELQTNYLNTPNGENFLNWGLDSFDLKDATSITAIYSATQVSVTLIYLDGTVENVIIDKDTKYTAPALTLDSDSGYTNLVWNNYNPDQTWTDGGIVESSIILVETATGKTYSVTLKYNNGNEDTEIYVEFGTAYGSILLEPERDGYIFNGWYDKNNKLITSDTIVSIAENHELTAQWIAINYTITFDPNGGSGNISPLYVTLESNVTLPADPVRLGYNFEGWFACYNENNEIEYTGENLEDIIGFADSNNCIELTAKWSAITYTVYFENASGNQDTGTQVSYDGTMSITFGSLFKNYYTFIGWKTGSSEVYSEGDELTIEKVIEFANEEHKLVFTPVWQAIEWTIDYKKVKGINNNPTKYTIESNTITLAPLSSAGYTFEGWYDNKDYEGDIVHEVAGTGNKTFYAKWTAIEYTVIFDFDVEGIDIENITTSMEENGGKVTLPTPVRQGYTFGGWRLKRNIGVIYTADHVELINILAYADYADNEYKITFTAVWSDAVYTIDYVLNGGVFSGNIIRSYKTNETVKLSVPSRSNYNFIGWYDNEECEGNSVTEFTDTTGNKIFYAKWERITVNIDFSIESWKYLEKAESPKVEDLNENAYAVWYGTPKKVSARMFRSNDNESVIISDCEWSKDAPEDAGTYYLLVYYLFDGEDTPFPTDGDTNGMAIREFEIKQIVNTVSINHIDDDTEISDGFIGQITYGKEFGLVFVTSREENAVITYQYFDEQGTKLEGMPRDAGTYKVKAISSETRNYEETESQVYTFEIVRATLTVTVSGSGVYGDEFGGWTFSFDGFAYNDTADVLNGYDKLNVTLKYETEKIGYGTHELSIYLDDTTATNYDLVAGTSYYVVSKRPINVQIEGITSVYSASIDLSGVTLSSNGLVLGDDISAVEAEGFTTTALAGSPVGIYPINCTGYSSENYIVSFVVGYYTISALEVELVITADGGVYGSTIEGAYISKINPTDARADRELIERELLKDGVFRIVYSGATYTNEVYGTPDIVPSQAGVYYATAIASNGNYNFVSSSKQFIISKKSLAEIEIASMEYTGKELKPSITSSVYYEYEETSYVSAGKYPITFTIKEEYANNYQWQSGQTTTVIFEITKAKNALLGEDLNIEGWIYGQYDVAKNSPTCSQAKFGTVIFIYSDKFDGVYTTSVPTAGNAGTYYIRAQVLGTADYKEFLSEPKEFTISQVVLDAPVLNLVNEGNGINTVYTGKDLYSTLTGFDSALMNITYDGTLIADIDSVTIVARNANTYTVKFTLKDAVNYCWSDGTVVDSDGYAYKVWEIQRVKVAVPTANNETFSVSGRMLTYLPVGFDESIMNIEGNREGFGGTYTVIVSLKDTENYEWADGTVGEIHFEWKVGGINKVFAAIMGTVGGLIFLAEVGALVQYLVFRRRKQLAQKAIDDLSNEAEVVGGDTPIDKPAEEPTDEKDGKEGK